MKPTPHVKLLFHISSVILLNKLQAQDPQDIADTACASFTSIYEFNSDDGYIESPNYPNYYPNLESCKWYLNPSGGIPDGQVKCKTKVHTIHDLEALFCGILIHIYIY